ncbi:hypothetical protein HS088_TW15G00441 [Tripterygium wilfordii]|uniref:Uncharacterized protein n=1 Tax=Tripterygium wilfordii TaxID=458696 RepID=A0A7J7CLJ8_TRIWF|nr:hypothetical protein HS088_TW15G00441 [Tripterygium wilfordii]
MKASSSTLVASVLAASTVALSSYFSSEGRGVTVYKSSNEGFSTSAGKTASDKEKFTPRFDGLRFIETLVTAHR